MTDTSTHDRATMRQQEPDLLRRMLARGDTIGIERGQLVILPASGKTVPPDWLASKRPELTRQILQAVGMDAFHYLSYTTGRYDGGKNQGLTMQLQSVITGADAYVIFNVELTRCRTTKDGKEGDPLPAGQFRATKKSNLSKLWASTGLPLRRLAAMHDYMGNLKGILFCADQTTGRADGRLIASTLQALHLPASVIRQAVLPDNCQTTPGQAPDNARTKLPDKESAPAQQPRGLQPFSGTGAHSHGKAVIRESGNTVIPFPPVARKKPEEQSVDEWLADYDHPSASP